MKENRNEVEIQGTVEEAWEVLTNFAQYSEWNPLIYRVEGKLKVGEKVEIFVKKGQRSKSSPVKLHGLTHRTSFHGSSMRLCPSSIGESTYFGLNE